MRQIAYDLLSSLTRAHGPKTPEEITKHFLHPETWTEKEIPLLFGMSGHEMSVLADRIGIRENKKQKKKRKS